MLVKFVGVNTEVTPTDVQCILTNAALPNDPEFQSCDSHLQNGLLYYWPYTANSESLTIAERADESLHTYIRFVENELINNQ